MILGIEHGDREHVALAPDGIAAQFAGQPGADHLQGASGWLGGQEGQIGDAEFSGLELEFFFATSEQPHLEGRYTAFGEVTEGEGVLDDLMEGEAIATVTARP